MPPNGDEIVYFDPGEVNRHYPEQTLGFKEIMTAALAIVQELTQGAEGGILPFVQEFAQQLQQCPDVPEKAKPFVQKLQEIAGQMNYFAANYNSFAAYDPEHKPPAKDAVNALNNLETLVNDLVEVSAGNRALLLIAKQIREDGTMYMAIIKETLKQDENLQDATEALDDLFES